MSDTLRLSRPERVYLSDVEIHRSSPIASAEDLRARVLFHVLFCDELLVGDSQSLNTPLFRALVSPDASRPGTVRADLGQLLDIGRIRVALRAGHTLRQVRDSQAERQVEHVPDVAYAEEMDRRTSGRTAAYDFDAVAAAFRNGVLSHLARRASHADGATRRVLEEAREWATGQNPLFYRALRQWAETYPRQAHGTTTEVVLALEAVDRAAGEAYRQALPTVLGAATAAPREGGSITTSASSRVLAEQGALPAGLLDRFLLGRVPVDVVLEATEQPARRALVDGLSALRSGRQADTDRLGEAVAEFAAWAQRAFERTFTDSDEQARAVLAGQRNLMRFGVAEDVRTGTLGAGLEVSATGEAEDAHLSVQFTERSVLPDTDGTPVYAGDTGVGDLRRAVVGATA